MEQKQAHKSGRGAVVELLTRLGGKLADFGRTVESRAVIKRACLENGWFQPYEVEQAVRAIRSEYLDRTKLTEWLERYPAMPGPRRRVLVVMAGNIPLVGFFDLLCVVAAGDVCLVKPSAKDRVLMEYMIDRLRSLDPTVPIIYYDGVERPDAVIATGSDNANRYFRTTYAGIPALLRGSRQSVAVLSGEESTEEWRALADDLYAYSGLGCRSISMLFVPKGSRVRLEVRAVNPKLRNNSRQRRALLEMAGERFESCGDLLLLRQREFPKELCEVSIAEYENLSEVEQWLAEHDEQLQCVVSNVVHHARCVPPGSAQTPGLTDYPDAVDVMEFLRKL